MAQITRDLKRARALMKAVFWCADTMKVRRRPRAVADLDAVTLEDLLLARSVVIDFLTPMDANYLPSMATIAAVWAAHQFDACDMDYPTAICRRADGADLVLLPRGALDVMRSNAGA